LVSSVAVFGFSFVTNNKLNMLLDIPFYISFVFVVALLITIFFFLKGINYSKKILLIVLIWAFIQGILSYSGFYLNTGEAPIKLFLAVFPPMLFTISSFISKKGSEWINTINLKDLTLLHIIRVPVELVLYWLFLYKAIPELMTFSGRNFDILAGITAPFVYYFGFVKQLLNKKVILGWNIVCLFLLLHIVVNAVLSAPLPIQQFAFDQPNIAVFNFPFLWLPSVIVPIVLFSHLVTIKRMW